MPHLLLGTYRLSWEQPFCGTDAKGQLQGLAQLVLPDSTILTLRDGACLWVGDRGADWTVSQQTGQCCPAWFRISLLEED